jgi:TonB-dependent siderophore receptor
MRESKVMPNRIIAVAIKKALRAAAARSADGVQDTLIASILGIAATGVCTQVNASPADPSTDSQSSLQEIVVSAVRFNSNDATSALKMPVDIKDIPQSVMSITGDVIDFASIQTFQDVYKIDASGGTSWTLDSFPRNYYRGFRQQGDNTIRIDGFRMSSDLQLDLSPYDRIEIVKGPTSTLYGQNQLGGTLNAISKAPKDIFGGDVTFEVGSFSDRRATADFFGPITPDGRLQYRVVSAIQDSDSFLDQYFHKIKLIAPTISYQIDDSTTLTTRFNYQDHQFRYHFGTGVQCLCDNLSAAVPGDFVLADIPRSVFFGQSWNTASKVFEMAQMTLEHKFQSNWTFRVSSQFNHLNEFSANDEELAPDKNGTTIYAALYANEKEDVLYAGEAQLFGDVELFGTRNTLFFGADYQYNKRSLLHGETDMFTGFNVFHPDYNLVPPHLVLDDYASLYNQVDLIREGGVTAQAFLRPIDRLTFLLGLRFDGSLETSDQRGASVGTGAGQVANVADFLAIPAKVFSTTTNKFTMQLGPTYALTPEINLYASYGQSFVPAVGVFVFSPTNPLGTPAPPEEGHATEIGAKGEFLDKKILGSVAIYDMVRNNVTSHHTTTTFVDVIGTQRGRGAEFEMQGAITPEFNLFASVAVEDPKYVRGPYNGMQPANSDKFGISLWSTYQFLGGPLKGFGLGGGVVNKDGRHYFGTDRTYANGQFVVINFGSITELDARMFYDTPHWRAELAATNLTNAKYYSPPRDVIGFGVDVNPPTEVSLKVTAKFGDRK